VWESFSAWPVDEGKKTRYNSNLGCVREGSELCLINESEIVVFENRSRSYRSK